MNRAWIRKTMSAYSGEIARIALNINHELFNFLDVLEDELEDLDDPLARRAAVALRTLLIAWARFQDETAENRHRAELEDIASQWGRHARNFLSEMTRDMTVGDTDD